MSIKTPTCYKTQSSQPYSVNLFSQIRTACQIIYTFWLYVFTIYMFWLRFLEPIFDSLKYIERVTLLSSLFTVVGYTSKQQQNANHLPRKKVQSPGSRAAMYAVIEHAMSINQTRWRSLRIDSYPLKSGQKQSICTCLECNYKLYSSTPSSSLHQQTNHSSQKSFDFLTAVPKPLSCGGVFAISAN